jgi:hypothetical protein
MAASAFSAHLPHFRSGAFAGADLAGLRPLGGQGPAPDDDYAAVARAREEAVAATQAAFEVIRARDLEACERRLAESERQFAEKTADVLAGKLAEGLAALEVRLSAQVARVLGRFLESAVRDRALGELSETVQALIATAGATRLKISGPEALVARFRQATASLKVSAEVVIDSASADVTVALDDTIVETRIAAWMDRVTEAASGGPHV